MSRQHFTGFLVAAVVAVLALWLLASDRSADHSSGGNGPLLPGLAQNVNDVDSIEIVGAGESTVASLARIDGVWVLGQWSNYPADWSVIQALLADLAKAVVVEEKTGNPEYYPRLGVEDITLEQASGSLLQLTAGDQSYSVIVGNRPQSGGGRFVRLENGSPALQVDKPLDLPAETAGWADREIVDITPGSVREVEVLHADGDRIFAQKPEPGLPDFLLLNLPDDRRLSSSWSVNQLGGALSALQLEAVRPAGDFDWSQSDRFRLQRFDGVEIIVDIVDAEDAPWVRLSAAEYPVGGDSAGPSVAADDAALINQRVEGWAYQIPRYRADTLTRRLEDILADDEGP